MDVISYALSKKYADKLHKGTESRLRNVEQTTNQLARMNISNEAMVTQTTEDEISYLPKNVSEKPLKFEVRGRTLVNLLGDKGDFKSTDSIDYVSGASISVVDGVLTIVTKSGLDYGRATIDITNEAKGKRVLIKANIDGMDSTNAVSVQVRSASEGNPTTLVSDTRIADGYVTFYVAYDFTAYEEDEISLWFFPRVDDDRNPREINVKEVCVYEVDQATYDAIGTMTDADIERMFPYVSGVQHVKNPMVQTTGKNLCELSASNRTVMGKSLHESIQYLGDGVWYKANNVWGRSIFTNESGTSSDRQVSLLPRLLPNETYTVSVFGSDNGLTPRTYDQNGKLLQNPTNTSVGGVWVSTFTTGTAPEYLDLQIRTNTDVTWRNLQIELGDKATSYEPYTSSAFHANTVLAGNETVQDELVYNVNKGVWEKIKWWEMHEMKDFNWALHADSHSVDYWSVGAQFADLQGVNVYDIIVTNYEGTKTGSYSGDYKEANELKVYKQLSSSNIYFKIPKTDIGGSGVTPEQVQAWFSEKDIKIVFPRTEPIIEEVETFGMPMAHPNGQIAFGNVLGNIKPYTADGIIEDGTFSEIIQVNRVDKETGAETDITDTCTLNDDRNGFTSTALSSGDLVWYELKVENTAHGALQYSYYDSRFVIEDSVTGTMYKYKIVAADGVPSIELEEI